MAYVVRRRGSMQFSNPATGVSDNTNSPQLDASPRLRANHGWLRAEDSKWRSIPPFHSALPCLLKSDYIEGLEITKEDIEDKADASAIIKLLAVLQILWFTTNVVGRAAQRMSLQDMLISGSTKLTVDNSTCYFLALERCLPAQRVLQNLTLPNERTSHQEFVSTCS